MYKKLFEEAVEHLVHVMGVAQTPQEDWCELENQYLFEARGFILGCKEKGVYQSPADAERA